MMPRLWGLRCWLRMCPCVLEWTGPFGARDEMWVVCVECKEKLFLMTTMEETKRRQDAERRMGGT